MTINSKKIFAIAAAFALGLILSNTLLAQAPTQSEQIERIEANIARLQAELATLKSQSVTLAPTTQSLPLDGRSVQGSTTRNDINIAPGYDARETVMAPEIVLPPIDLPSTGVAPQASTAPTLTGPSSQIILAEPASPSAPILIQPQPTFVVPMVDEYCPLTGRLYRVQRSFYAPSVMAPSVMAPWQPAPRYQYEWDYLDEDRLDRERNDWYED